MRFAEIMELESHGPDTWEGRGPSYPWGGLYGGQIVAQALAAAAASVASPFRIHSLHAFFIRLGNHEQPVRYEVDRIRDGRSFVTRRVVARQSSGAILNLAASYTSDEPGRTVQTQAMPALPEPESLDSDSWSPLFDRRYAERVGGGGRATAWLRMAESIDDNAHRHACALAFLSDDLPTEAVIMAHPACPESLADGDWPFWNASLDHAIWFHRPMRADAWHVHDFSCRALMGARGLSVGNIFDADGAHVASVTQEVLLRERRST
ncbi:MAG: thioesterase family protein [Deltaproteobacteria bacterium]|nr:thioesterase family protein [Deltaproteobacteria bacterium]MBW2419247.1 thioesterase family protein [Deltaproteobacteria bacterium]